jgi:fermentation-respiration switch protein FrsA (DUF1100 family)
MRIWSIALFAGIAWPVAANADAKIPDVQGTVEFVPRGDQRNIPECYRLEKHRFDFAMTQIKDLPINGFSVYELCFPSPVTCKWPENNTVWAEYYRPKGPGPFPCVIVLDITGGDQTLSRVISRHLAHKNIAGLFVQMAYYGPRRPAGGPRLLSLDIPHTLDAVRQTVLDLRRATAWMESRAEIDARRLGIMGTSLGSFMAALTAEMEPKLGRVAVLLGGGGFVDAFYDHPQAAPYRKVFEALGGSKEQIARAIAPVDPLTRADLLRERKVLMVAARHDEIVPPRMAQNLWNATGRQRIIWLNAGHFTAALYLPAGLKYVVEHFGSR